jgi:hypothetical protein
MRELTYQSIYVNRGKREEINKIRREVKAENENSVFRKKSK